MESKRIARNVEAISSIVRRVSPSGQLHAPRITAQDMTTVRETMIRNEVSSVGASVNEFSRRLENYLSSPRRPIYAVPVVSGTAALELSLRLAGVLPGDLVITTPISFIATCNAIHNVGATPVFVDIHPFDLRMDITSLNHLITVRGEPREGQLYIGGKRVAACVPVYALGLPWDSRPIVQMCSRYGIAVVEDAAEALGSMVGACQVGTFGDIGILSFNGNKVITTGGGGAIITRDKKLADRARHLSTQAKTKHPYEYIHDQHGFNMRMPALNAALGVSQMDALSWILCRKAQNFYYEYSDVFCELDLPYIRPSESYSWNCWLVSFNAESRRQRDAYLKAFHRRGIQARPLWAPLNAYGPYAGCESMPTPGADQAYDQIVCLPSGVGG